MKPRYKFQWYQGIRNKLSAIRKDAKEIAIELGLNKLSEGFGLYPGSSFNAGALPNYVLEAIIEANKSPVPSMRKLGDQLREVVKDVYGDEYDAACTNTCEAALRVAYSTLFAPPTLRKGDTYRTRFIAPYGEDFEYLVALGRPFPPKYKNLLIDRGVSAGELGMEGKSLANLDAILVRLVGAKYDVHGINYNPVPQLTNVDAVKSSEKITEVASRHSSELSGFASIGYDTPGYGYGEKDENGIPILKKLIGNLAIEYDVPYLVDCASGAPVIGLAPKDINADVMMWSMDKAVRAPISGLLVGTEEIMVPIRKSLGLGGHRSGEVSSHSKAVFSLCDPGRDALIGVIEVLKMLRDKPNNIIRTIDKMHQIIEEEFKAFTPSYLQDGFIITKSYTMGGSEVNYEQTWQNNEFGIPLFSCEDLWANINPIMLAIEEMGVEPATIYSGTMFLAPGVGNIDEDGNLIEENTRLAVRALVRATELVCKYSGLVE